MNNHECTFATFFINGRVATASCPVCGISASAELDSMKLQRADWALARIELIDAGNALVNHTGDYPSAKVAVRNWEFLAKGG